MDRRFAIIIGINDYNQNPLDFCYNDAFEIKNNLISNCKFKSEDIFLISSNTENSIKDITGKFEFAIQEIQQRITSEVDSIFFYFAGHGEYKNLKSGLYFQDSFIEIEYIFNKINNLNPKYQCYVIDACESGSKVITRGNSNNNTDIVSKYLNNSNGVLFMYASTENEYANELESLKHGLFTYYFLEAIKDKSLYDEDGILTPNRIQDFIASRTLKESRFSQTPVIENRTIGYYPFAFLESIDDKKEVDASRNLESNKDQIENEFFPEIPYEIRTKLFKLLEPKINLIFESFIEENENLSLKEGKSFSLFDNYDTENKLTDSIVNNSVKNKIVSIGNIFSSERELVKPNPLAGFITSFLQKGEEYHYYNNISWSSSDIISKTLYSESSKITEVSCGFGIIIYQSLFGIGIAKISFYYDYNGITNENLKGPYTEIIPLKINQFTIEKTIQSVNKALETFKLDIKKWNQNRLNAIEDFDKKTR